jgi:ADP-ribosyl-[dinitrogen reductase] hydrolase
MSWRLGIDSVWVNSVCFLARVFSLFVGGSAYLFSGRLIAVSSSEGSLEMPSSLERYRGALLGLATGDAIGTTLEFQLPGSFAPIDDMVGGGPFKLAPGQWTDDTSLALCLAESLVERRGFDAIDQLERYLRWYDTGYLSSTGYRFDAGDTTSTALETFRRTRDPHSGPTGPRTASNGSIMRLAPVALFYATDSVEAIERCADSSRTTHGAAASVDGCRYLGALLVGALHGTRKAKLLASHFGPAGYWKHHPLVPEIDEVAAGSFRRCEPPTIESTGYVVKCLEAALWAFHHAESFRQGVLLAVNLGGDADTTGAVFGQLAGAYYGARGIPRTWREKLAHRELIESLADRLFKLGRDR